MRSGFDRERFYLSLPVPIQNMAASLEGRRLQRRRYDAGYDKVFTETVGRTLLHGDDLRRHQERSLRAFLISAGSAPYWRERFHACGVDPASTNPLAEIDKLPVISKEEVKSNHKRIVANVHSREKPISCHTSGTTGSGLIFPMTREAERAQWATWWRYRGWHGITQEIWCGYFGGRSIVSLGQKNPPYWRINCSGRQIIFSGYHLSDENAKDYVAAIANYGIAWLHGYPSLLSLLAGYIIDQGLPVPSSVRIVTTGAENLLPQQRERIKQGFGADVYQHYGQAEGIANFSECKYGHLHVDEDYSLVEFLPVADENGACRVIGTNWTNHAFPLIRYDCGDLATPVSGDCCCGKPGRLVSKVDGRKEDYLFLPNGTRIGRLDHIFKDLVHIREGQIFQREPGSVVFRVVKGYGYDVHQEEQNLLIQARKRLGTEIRIIIEYHDRLPRIRSGKLRFVVSDIPEARIDHEADSAKT